jgi:uncharacterized protein YcaQ
VPVDVEGVRGKRFVLAEELALLQAPPEPAPSVAFIAPFDSLLWDNPLVASLFGFDYVWEGFFPPAKRRWGWYVLPISFRDRLVGRIEPRIDRDQARVEVLARVVSAERPELPGRCATSTRATSCWPPAVATAAAWSRPSATSPRTASPVPGPEAAAPDTGIA